MGGGARVHVVFTAKSFGNTPGLATGVVFEKTHVAFTAKSFGNTLGLAPRVVLKKAMSFLQPSHLETHQA